jgi:radical SAM-linked protein
MFVHHKNASDASADQRRLVCYDCGVACDMTTMKSRRIDLLKKMGAIAPVEVTPEPEVRRDPQQPERYRPPRAAGEVARWRLRYAKTGASSLLGHLDLVRELGRVIRRASVRIAYTEGFHPKPDMSFGPALSLGVLSTDEYVDVKLIDAPPAEELVSALDAAAAGGLRFLGAAELTPADPALGRIVCGARYLISMPASLLAERGPGWLESRIQEFCSSESLRVIRRVKGLGKPIDVRAAVESLRLCPADDPALGLLRSSERLVTLEVRLSISEKGSAKLTELMEALVGDPAIPYLAVRVELVAKQGRPFDLEQHRNAPRSAPTKASQPSALPPNTAST